MLPQITGELQTILTAAAFAPIDRAFLRISGPDAARWLNGMVTNNIQALQPGEGNYNFLLNAQGRIQGDCLIYRDPANVEPDFLLESDTAQIDTLHQLLDRFIIMDDVELTRSFADETSILLLGPQAYGIVGNYCPTRQDPLHIAHLGTVGSMLLLTPAPGLAPRFEFRAAQAPMMHLRTLLQAYGTAEASRETLEALRVLEARPRYGTDIRNTDTAKDLPQETNQTHALHFAKGCYVGQEIVERIRSRGQVHRLFTPFRLEGDLPTTLPAPLEADGKPAGDLTSAVTISTTKGPTHLALGYGRREFLEAYRVTKTPLTYAGGTAHPRQPGQLT